MKNYLFLAFILISLSSCKNEPKVNPTTDEEIEIEQSIPSTEELMAQKAGIGSWNDVREIKFTFNVDKDGATVMSRIWKWNPNTNDVRLIARTDTVVFNRSAKLDSIQTSADRAFINDVYWLLPEFKLVWDEGIKITEKKDQAAPISKETLDMITVLYGEEGGYTPGDAYDIYYDKNHQFKEWVFRKGNDTTATMMTTFESFETYNGITLATDHRSPDGFTNINFTDIEVIKKQ